MQRIFGYYDSEFEVITIVNNLGLKGYKTKNITIFTNQHIAYSLGKKTNVNIHSSIDHTRLYTKTLSPFKKRLSKNVNNHTDLYAKLVKFGFSEKQANISIGKINHGKILIVVKDIMKLGHAPLNEIIKEKI